MLGSDRQYAQNQTADGTVKETGIEVAHDQSDTRGTLFHWDNSAWQRIAVPPLTGWVYALALLPSGQIVLGGDFTAMRAGPDWQQLATGITGYGWIVDIEVDLQGTVWALTHSGNLFQLKISQ